jgi:hypothetical protein
MSKKPTKAVEMATAQLAEKVESIRQTLKDACDIADAYGLEFTLLDEFGNYLRYTGRVYDVESDYHEDGGWYSSHC